MLDHKEDLEICWSLLVRQFNKLLHVQTMRDGSEIDGASQSAVCTRWNMFKTI